MTDLAADLYYDPYDYAIDADPYPVWKRLRDEAPVYFNEKYGFYALSRFEDVKAASLDWQTFSSGRGTLLELMDDPEAIAATRAMINMDPSEHTHLRALAGRVFTPRRVSQLEGWVRELCAEYLDPFVGGSGFDVVADFGARIPMMVISAFLGVPLEDRETIRQLADLTLARSEGETGFRFEPFLAMGGYFGAAAAVRKFVPRDDFITELVNIELTEDDGTKRPLTDEEVVRFLGLLAIAGNETVARLVGFMATTLAKHPDQRQLLVEDPSLIPNAVEEILRYEAPSPSQGRYVVRDVEIHGVTIPAGSKALLLNAAANRDEREFDDPDRFDVRRKTEHHISFGFGPHFCLGAALARLEGRIALEELLKRFPTWDVDWDNAAMIHTSSVRGFEHVPVRY